MSKKIIVLDDDRGILEVVKIILEEKGYQVMTINNGLSIQNKIIEYQPDLILMDIWMAGIDGRSITKNLKAQEHTKNIPIIILSALSDVGKIAKESGADGFLQKPFNIEELVISVEKIIKKSRENLS